MTMRVKWPHLSFLKGTYRVRDVWQKQDLGITDKDFIREISSHDVILLTLTLKDPVK
jgi:hypothetical protein